MALNSDKPWPTSKQAEAWVLCIQRKLHRWSLADSERRFDDLYNLVHDRSTLLTAWNRIRRNKGSRTAGVDGVTRHHIEQRKGVHAFLSELRAALKSRTYRPQPVKEKTIPKPGGKMRYLGIPTLRDRVVQMALKLVLEPIFEVDFCPTSYGYRPARRAQDAIAEIVQFINPRCRYEWAVEGDIKACFDNVHHGILMEQTGQRIKDRKVLKLVRQFLKAGVMKQGQGFAATLTGTPQGGIISPLLANIYLSVLDRHFEREWQHQTRYVGCTTYYRRRGHATYRMVRYADDFVILVRGTRDQAEHIRDEAARVIRDGLKMELSVEKTLITHVDKGFDFLGHHVRRVPWNGNLVAWTFPSKKSLESIKNKIRNLTGRSTLHMPLRALLIHLNPVLRGWANYFRYDASKRTLSYVGHFAWRRVLRWLYKKHAKRSWKYIRRRYCGNRWTTPAEDGIELFQPAKVKVERYRYRGKRILLPWMEPEELGKVGPYARGVIDEPTRLGTLQEALRVT